MRVAHGRGAPWWGTAWLLSALLVGCSAAPVPPPQTPKMQAVLPESGRHPVDIYDPWEGFNRRMYRFNAQFDLYVYLPVVHAYERVMPAFAEAGVSNFFANLTEINSFINALLQLKPRVALKAGARLLINSSIGLFGLWDPASRLGIIQQREDFGQVLAHYRVAPGPYLVLPLLGPSSLRDAPGLALDAWVFGRIDPLDFEHHSERQPPFYILKAIDARHRVKFRYYQTGSPFEYELVRYLYIKKRELDTAK